MPKITVMLVDDHAVVRAGYRMLLSQNDNITVTAEASRGEDACQNYTEIRPDIIVMDINLPGMNGVECVRQL